MALAALAGFFAGAPGAAGAGTPGLVSYFFRKRSTRPSVSTSLYLPVKNGAKDLALAAAHPDKLPIGFLIFVLDRQDPQQSIFGHARPLIVENPRGIELNTQALSAYERKIKDRLADTGVIPDERN